MTRPLTRRAALIGLAAVPSLAVVRPALAQAVVPAYPAAGGPSAGLRIRSVVIDATRVAALGSPAGADRLSIALARQMRVVFGDLMAPKGAPGAVLVARISSLYLSAYNGGRAYGRGGAGGGNDSLEGAGIVKAGGRVASETPILAVLDPADSGAWYLPDIDERRIDAISYQFAWWLRREMGV